jgi:hypothetical protein
MWVNHGEAWLTILFVKHPMGCLTYKLDDNIQPEHDLKHEE